MVAGGSAVAQLEVCTPWNGDVVGSVDRVDLSSATRAIDTAYELYRDRSSWLSGEQRIKILTKAQQIILARSEELAEQAALEGGKPVVDSRVELARAADGVQSCVEYIRTGHGEEIPMGITASSMNRLAMTHKEPIGVVLAYSAFNHPFNLIVHQVGPALAAGCPVVVKPSADTPLSCFAFVEILREAGLPEEYCQAVVVDNDEAGELMTHRHVGFFSFIGSAKIGWTLRGKLAPGARCALEHGGIAPVILAEDADLDDCLPLVAKGGFYHAGQVCVSVQRVYAQRAVAERVTERLAGLAAGMVIGDPASPDTDVGPLIRHSEVDRVEQWVNEAVADGAELICGGSRVSDSAFECTVLLDPPEDCKLSKEEIFGPVICVYAYDDIEDAVSRANDERFVFQSAVFSRSVDTAMYCCRRLDAGTVTVNDHTAFRVDWMPFAGYRQSGLGTGGIAYTCRDMQMEKLLVLRSKNL